MRIVFINSEDNKGITSFYEKQEDWTKIIQHFQFMKENEITFWITKEDSDDPDEKENEYEVVSIYTCLDKFDTSVHGDMYIEIGLKPIWY